MGKWEPVRVLSSSFPLNSRKSTSGAFTSLRMMIRPHGGQGKGHSPSRSPQAHLKQKTNPKTAKGRAVRRHSHTEGMGCPTPGTPGSPPLLLGRVKPAYTCTTPSPCLPGGREGEPRARAAAAGVASAGCLDSHQDDSRRKPASGGRSLTGAPAFRGPTLSALWEQTPLTVEE